MIYLRVSEIFNEVSEEWRPCCSSFRLPRRYPFSAQRAAWNLAIRKAKFKQSQGAGAPKELYHLVETGPRGELSESDRLDRIAIEWLIKRGFREPAEREDLIALTI